MNNELKYIFKFFFVLFILLIIFDKLSFIFIYLDKIFLSLLGARVKGDYVALVHGYDISKICSGSIIIATTLALVISDQFKKKLIRALFCFVVLFFYNVIRIYFVLIYGTIFHIISWMFFIVIVLGAWYLSIKLFLDDKPQNSSQTTKGFV